MGRPRVVLLDEPAAGLPDEETEHLSRVIQAIPGQFGALVILVDHDMSLVQACCETTAVLDFGKLIASGPTREVLRDEHVIRAYLGTRGRSVMTATAAVERASRSTGLSVARGGPPGAARRLDHDPAGRGHRAARAERRREVDPRADGRRRPAPDLRHDPVGDVELTRRRPEQIRTAGVAIVPEGRQLLPNLTVEDNLRVATYALGRHDARSGIAHALELFPELEKRWRITARSLSGGEQQMVVLAQALVSRPKFVLVDELSLGLAPLVVQRLVPTLEAVAASGVGVLLIEQFAHVALGLAQTAYVLERGRIHYHGTAQQLKDEPELLQSAYLLRGQDAEAVARRPSAARRRRGAAAARGAARKGELAGPEGA